MLEGSAKVSSSGCTSDAWWVVGREAPRTPWRCGDGPRARHARASRGTRQSTSRFGGSIAGGCGRGWPSGRSTRLTQRGSRLLRVRWSKLECRRRGMQRKRRATSQRRALPPGSRSLQGATCAGTGGRAVRRAWEEEPNLSSRPIAPQHPWLRQASSERKPTARHRGHWPPQGARPSCRAGRR